MVVLAVHISLHMASITIKNIPDSLLSQLRERAATEKRSMNKEIIRLLDPSLSVDRAHTLEHRRTLAQAQTQAWGRLAGRWVSDVPVEDEIAHIYAARSGGRELEPCERIDGLRTEDWVRG